MIENLTQIVESTMEVNKEAKEELQNGKGENDNE